MKPVPPCGYQGGKRKHAEQIADLIISYQKENIYDCCSGSGAVTIALISKGIDPASITMVEAGPWALFWKAISNKTLDIDLLKKWLIEDPVPPEMVGQWLLKDIATREPSAEVFLVLQAGSYGGTPVWWDGEKWRRGSYKTKRLYKPRSYWTPKPESKETKPRGTIFRPDKIIKLCEMYLDKYTGLSVINDKVENIKWWETEDCLIYIDPDYGDASSYGWSVEIERFIEETPRPLLISEQIKIDGADRYIDVGKRRSANVTKSRNSSQNQAQEWLNVWE